MVVIIVRHKQTKNSSEKNEIYDVIIVGAGPAGLSAALTACYLKLKHLVLEAGESGGALTHLYPWKEVDSFLGFYNMTGKEVAEKMVEHVKKEGSLIKEGEEVISITKNEKDHTFNVKTEKDIYKTKTVLFAGGTSGTPRRLEIPGEHNPCVHYCVREYEKYKGKKVLVVGGGDAALETALFLDKVGANVTLIHRKEEFRATLKNQEEIKKSKVNVILNTELKEIFGKENIEKVKLVNNKTNEEQFMHFDYVIICIGSVFSFDSIKDLGVKIEGEKIIVDDEMKTNVEGFYAAGDVTGRLKRIPEAIGEGHLAIYSIFKYLKKPYWA